MCCVRVCAIPGTVLLFTLAKQTREFHLETQCTPETLSLCLPKTLLSLSLSLALFYTLSDLLRFVFAFLFVIASLHPPHSLCTSLPFSLILALSCFSLCSTVSLHHSPSLSVCLSKRQISSLGETLEDSPSVYK